VQSDYKVNGTDWSEAKPPLRQRQLQIRTEQRCHKLWHRISQLEEASRNIFGNLQGTRRGQIEVFVEASGFAANLTCGHR